MTHRLSPDETRSNGLGINHQVQPRSWRGCLAESFTTPFCASFCMTFSLISSAGDYGMLVLVITSIAESRVQDNMPQVITGLATWHMTSDYSLCFSSGL